MDDTYIYTNDEIDVSGGRVSILPHGEACIITVDAIRQNVSVCEFWHPGEPKQFQIAVW